MIPASGAGGPGFKSRLSPFPFFDIWLWVHNHTALLWLNQHFQVSFTWWEGCALNMQCYKDKNKEHPCKKIDPKNSIDIQAELTYGEKTLLRSQPKSFVSIFPHLWLMAIIAWNFHCKHLKDQLGPPWVTKNPHFLLKASLGLPCTFLQFLLKCLIFAKLFGSRNMDI